MNDIKELMQNIKPCTRIGQDVCGIYAIFCEKANKVYIGSSTNLSARITSHKSALRGKSHTNKEMQEHFNRFSECGFTFGILDTYKNVPNVVLRIKEQEYVNNLDPNLIYNKTDSIFQCDNITRLPIDELVHILLFEDKSENVVDLKEISEKILAKKIKDNPASVIDYIKNIKNKTNQTIRISELSDFTDSQIMHEAKLRIDQFSRIKYDLQFKNVI